MTSTIRTFLPWVRQGLSGSVTTVDAPGAKVPGRVAVPVEVWVDDPKHERPQDRLDIPLRFSGPGDVTGIDPRQVVRVDPPNLSTAADPHQFPAVEFDRPDFPWLFTPARADSDGRLRPWLVLVVVERESSELQTRPGAPLPVLDAPLAELPPLADSWAWAHAQVTHAPLAGGGSSLDLALESQPERTVSRLLAPRRLRSTIAYRACVVPAFAAGRKAGLGEALSEDDERELLPAWPVAGGAPRVQVPVYYHYEFTTGAQQDFETLARQLRPRTLPDVGVLSVDVGAPGWGIPGQPPGTKRVQFTGALRRPDQPVETEDQVDSGLRSELRRVIGAAGGPDVAPPIYGLSYTNEPTVPLDGTPPHWLRELNLDPRTRIAAGLGTLVVRYEQERLMAAAWHQLAAHERSVQDATRAQLAEELSSALSRKLVATTAPIAGAQAYAVTGPSLLSEDDEFLVHDAPYRRLLAPGGVIGRRVARSGAGLRWLTAAGEQHQFAVAPAAAAPHAAPGGATETPRFAPDFVQPMYEALRDWFEELLLPGIGQVPPDTVALLETNPRLVEAFLVGLNHELGRELLWRGYPTDLRATYFRRFWGPAKPAAVAPAGTVPPVRDWKPDSRLGEHLVTSGAGGQLVLLIRGQILALFPRAVVYAVRAAWTDGGGRSIVAGSERYPVFQGTVGTDGTFVGFDLSPTEARGAPDRSGDAGWFFVIQEQPTEPRFGFDPGDGAAKTVERIGNWADLTWADVDGTQPYVPVEGRLQGQTRPAGTAPAPGGTVAPSATWGTNAAHMALIAQQLSFRTAIHACAWLPSTGSGR